jgi:hypothetical protein
MKLILTIISVLVGLVKEIFTPKPLSQLQQVPDESLTSKKARIASLVQSGNQHHVNIYSLFNRLCQRLPF